MSADELREAAALMRERAQAATPGPWFVPQRGTGIDAGEYDTVVGPGPVSCMAYCYGGTSTLDGDRLEVDQAHIASWYPAVALDAADLLEVIAEDVGTSSLAYKAAERFARAYLGRDL